MKLSITFILIFTFGILNSQNFNVEFNEDGASPKLLGKINKDGLSEEPYADWYNMNFESYEVDSKWIEAIGENLNNYRIELYMGTWCGDSKREVPRFYKVLEALDFPLERLTAVAVDNDSETYKQSPGGEHEGKNIHRVPTFILYKGGREINRIVESPKTTIEEDIHNILSGDYIPNYEAVHLLHSELYQRGVDGIMKRSRKLVKQLEPLVGGIYDLNTYANVLFYDGRRSAAIEVLKLNLKLFPEEAYAHASLGSKLGQMGITQEAITYLERAIRLDPDDDRYMNKLNELRSSL